LRFILPVVFLAFAFFLAVACGGGGQESSSEVPPIRLKVNMVYPQEVTSRSKGKNDAEQRQKFAVLSPDTPFRIGSDLSDLNEDPPGDPIHATQARATFFNDGLPVARGTTNLARYTTNPGLVTTESRSITVSSVYGDNLSLLVEVGQDFGEVLSERTENVFYVGNVQNIKIVGSNVIVDGVMSDNINVQLKTNIDRTRGLYTLQGYLDYSHMPLVALTSDADDALSQSGKFSLTSIESLDQSYSPPSYTNIVTSGTNLFDAQVFFFEFTSLPISQTLFKLTGESGPSANVGGVPFWSKNMVLSGLVTPEDALSGNPLVFDFETTFNAIMALWYTNPLLERRSDLTGSAANIVPVYGEMAKVYKKIEPILSYGRSGNLSSPLEVRPQDLSILQLVYKLVRELNTGDVTGTTVTSDRFHNKIGLQSSAPIPNALDHFVLGGNLTYNGNVLFQSTRLPVLVNFDGVSDNLILEHPISTYQYYVNTKGETLLDSAGNTVLTSESNIITTSLGNVVGYKLSDLFAEKVSNPFFGVNGIWNYVESFTALSNIGPIPTTPP
jgi:hypothetical protein